VESIAFSLVGAFAIGSLTNHNAIPKGLNQPSDRTLFSKKKQ